ncbi:MAG: alpha-amylase family glycosyl hydrolase, partial [Verrucomicrobia bacterium]|nr:alpha-amylase family glycosyl hydrolase [Verrucomicrobiota bacterium]
IEQKLDYIKSLGATAIWISPILLNANGEFHGYAAWDFFKIDPHWGTLADLQHMTAAAHAKGLLVINDIVVNHGGDLIYSTDSGYSTFKAPPNGYNIRYRSSKQFAAPFNTNAANPTLGMLFHTNGAIQNYGDTTQVELGELSGLDDFRTESEYVRSNMAAVYNYWIQTAGFDGYRIDTVKHVEMGFWQYWCPQVHDFAATNGNTNFFLFGEVADGSDGKCGSYTGTQGGGAFKLDSVVDYPLYYKIPSVFGTATGNTKQIEDRYGGIAGNYDPAAQMSLVTFLDNHDQARFLSSGNANNNTNRLAVALAFLMTARGIPCVYYGTEQAFNGATDPNDREDMFDGQFEQGPSLGDNFNETHPLFQLIAKLNNFRRLYPALQTGAHVNLWNNPGGAGLFAYARRLGTQEVFIAFNTSGSSQTLTNRPTIYPAGTTLVNLLNPSETITTLAGPVTPVLVVPGTAAKIFIAQSQQLPLDPVVASVAPAHDAASVPAGSALTIQFSKPMDTNSVVAAFATTPATTGSFAWSATNTTLSYTPAGGWPGLTLVMARIGDTARDAVSSNNFYAAFESRFTTAVASDLTPPTVAITAPAGSPLVTGALAIAGTAADNVAVQKVEVRVDSGTWATASGTTSWNFNLNTTTFLNGSHVITVRATDAGGNTSPLGSVTARFVNVPGDYLQRVACGSTSNIADCASDVWLSDRAYASGAFGYAGGTPGYVSTTITGVCATAQALYQHERYSVSSGGYRYFFDCPPGIYETTLVEAETYWAVTNQRVFDVYIEGNQVLANCDLIAAVGKNVATNLVFTNTVADGQLDLELTPVVDNARCSAIQVRKLADLYSDTDGIPDWWRLAYFDHATGSAADKSRAADDADGDGVSNGEEFLAGTNPLDANSVFRITTFIRAGLGGQVIWPTVTNRIYQLEQRDTLDVMSGWTNAGAPVIGNGGAVTQGIAGSNAVMQFFRIRTP